MTEKKYVLKLNPQRRGDLSHHSKYLLVVEGEDGKGYEEPIDDVVGDLLRKVTDVEDRTRLDYSDVPVGTAGTADVNDGENAGEFRAVKEPGGFRVYGQHGYWFVRDLYVTDFTPDRVVDEALIERVREVILRVLYNPRLTDEVTGILRGTR